MPTDRHPIEIANLAEVEEAISYCAEQKRYLGQSFVLGLHYSLMKGVPEEPGHPVKPGQLRDYTDKMDAARVAYLRDQMSPAWRVREDLIALLNIVEEGCLPGDRLEQVARFHYRFVRIHPFCDGNGRMARALSAFLMARGGYPEMLSFREPVSQIILDHRRDYFDVLEYCDGLYKSLEDSDLTEDEKLERCESAFVLFYSGVVLLAFHKNVVALEEDLINRGHTDVDRVAPLSESISDLRLEAIVRQLNSSA